MVVPTPAAAKIAPSEASICGRTTAQPIAVHQPPALLYWREHRRPEPSVADDQRNDHAEAEQTRVTALGSISPLPFSGV